MKCRAWAGKVKADPASLWWLDHGASAHSCTHPSSKLSVDLAPSLFRSRSGFWSLRKPTNWRAALRAGKGDFPCWRPHLWIPGLAESDGGCWGPESLDNLQWFRCSLCCVPAGWDPPIPLSPPQTRCAVISAGMLGRHRQE